MAQWLRIHLQMQETQVQSPAQEDSTCLRATKPGTATTEIHISRADALQQEKPPQWESPCAATKTQHKWKKKSLINTNTSQTLLQTEERWRLPSLFYEVSFTLIPKPTKTLQEKKPTDQYPW